MGRRFSVGRDCSAYGITLSSQEHRKRLGTGEIVEFYKSYRDQSERLFSKASLIPCSSYCSAVGIANGLCEGHELLFRQTHQPSQLRVIDRAAKHAREPFRGAEQVDILANEAGIY